jgi:hypothetical protein
MRFRDKQLIVMVTATEKEKIRNAFGSFAAMRDYIVDIAEMMLEGKDDKDAKKEKERA